MRGLSYLLQAQLYNPVLWALYGTCTYLHNYKPQSFLRKEIIVLRDYYLEKKTWLSGNFSELCDLILIDDVTYKKPNYALVTKLLKQPLWDDEIPNMYYIPVEWLKCIAIRNGMFVLLPFEFCCEILVRSNTQLIRCQSLNLEPEYFVDKTYFHIGCGPCTPVSESLVEVFASVNFNVGSRNLMKMFENYGEDFINCC